MILQQNISTLYPKKSNFYRKLDTLCSGIYELNKSQSRLFDGQNSQEKEFEIPDYNKFTTILYDDSDHQS